MEDSIPDRYERNPMLALVENYIIDALGMLEPEQAARLAEIVERTFGSKDWRATIRDQFGLPESTPATLLQLWKTKQEEYDLKQEDLTVEGFAQMEADRLLEGMGS